MSLNADAFTAPAAFCSLLTIGLPPNSAPSMDQKDRSHSERFHYLADSRRRFRQIGDEPRLKLLDCQLAQLPTDCESDLFGRKMFANVNDELPQDGGVVVGPVAGHKTKAMALD